MNEGRVSPRPDAPEGRWRGRNEFAVRDRVLLYLTEMGLGDVLSLELAAECLRRADPDSSQEEAMAILDELLETAGLGLHGDEAKERLHSFPTLNRRTMIASRVDGFSLSAATRRLARRVLGFDARGRLRPTRRKGA